MRALVLGIVRKIRQSILRAMHIVDSCAEVLLKNLGSDGIFLKG
jgi:hypothetical protein